MYSEEDQYRIYEEEPSELGSESYRTDWRRDYARLLHSPCFRRLQGKTQLFPTQETDFFRNRLTHSLEVAQIAKSIAIRLNNTTLKSTDHQICEDLCEFAGLAHDIGHPPFGHQGESALDECMRNFGGFEGNAQTLRILSKIEKKIIPKGPDGELPENNFISNLGLNLTMRSLASILKYDRLIPLKGKDREKKWRNKAMKGYYDCEKDVVKEIKTRVLSDCNKFGDVDTFKTVECQIMDIADDIAYSTYDLEDGFKASFMEPMDIMFAADDVINRTAEKVNDTLNEKLTEIEVTDYLFDIFNQIFKFDDKESEEYEKDDYAVTKASAAYHTSKKLASDGFFRTQFTSRQVGEAIRGVKIDLDNDCPALSKVTLDHDLKIKIEILKHYVYESQIDSPKLKIFEYRGKEIIKDIFDVLTKEDSYKLLPADYQYLFKNAEGETEEKRIVCDFISGMTDRYCSEFYYRIKSENPKTIFKPF